MQVCDALTGKDVLVQLGVLFDPSDNPMQSEICGHIGDKGDYACQKCEVGGTRKEKEMNPVYDDLFEPQHARSLEKMKEAIGEQLKVACTGDAKEVAKLQTDSGIKDAFTQVWIEKILVRFCELKAVAGCVITDITTELLKWVNDSGDEMYSSFLALDPRSWVQYLNVQAL